MTCLDWLQLQDIRAICGFEILSGRCSLRDNTHYAKEAPEDGSKPQPSNSRVTGKSLSQPSNSQAGLRRHHPGYLRASDSIFDPNDCNFGLTEISTAFLMLCVQ